MRVLQVIWDAGGNVPPQLAIARELVRRGHEVRMLGHRVQRDRVEATGAAFVPFTHAPDADASRPETDLIRDWEARTPIGAFARTRDNVMYGPALRFAQDVADELREHPADVVAFDFLLVGAGVGAEATGVPAAAIMHTVFTLPRPGIPPFGEGLRPARGPLGRARDALLTRGFRMAFKPGLEPLNAARRELGLREVDDPFAPIESADRVLVLTAREFDYGDLAELPANARYCGAVLDPTPPDAGWDSPWPPADPRPMVLVSFSTTFQDQDGLAGRVLTALADLPVRGLFTTGPAIGLGETSRPPNVQIRDFVPHAAVLPEADVVVCHAGLGTVHAALAHGVPVVCIPDGRDQNDNAARVVHAGAGVRLRKGSGPSRIRAAISRAAEDPALREAADRMAAALEGDGAATVADELETLTR